jgi:tRNA (guanine-N(7)-)-methyltransferase subunit TRM82
MPKRPCALALTNHDSTIIAADKFGDVYSLPLLFSESESLAVVSGNDQPSKPFVPAANDLTVHSQRNRKALENQKKQKNKAPEKSEPTFEHKLLLGHVSLLTDVEVADIQDRSYIITADRDEHIRISRGIPQSHIIESFCLGHTEFVSRLCVPHGRPNLLVSGGGDKELYVWDWLTGGLVSKADLESLITSAVSDAETRMEYRQVRKDVNVAVSNISYARVLTENGSADIILVTSEG